ncbi:hypothetical protein [Heliothis virescens ascovirus 3j]|uniref:Uyr/REP helicase n=2 Tax=unclassified Ascovirus TaxID=328613 RepID=A0A2Z5UZT4_9VIRU|nr:Uyr/REP helicase [Heliothis virescens ascovirus 3h]BBB16623.1 hypothetical protein [Heliothis virescens ascovirus 3j]
MEIKHILFVIVALVGGWLAWKRATNDTYSVFTDQWSVIIIAALVIILALWRRMNGYSGTWQPLRQGVNTLAEYGKSADDALLDPTTSPSPVFARQGGESKGEIACRSHLERRFRVPFAKVRPDWLINPNTKAKLELDCYNEDLRLAVEYNGRQHYEYVPRFHNCPNDLTTQIARDVVKHEICRGRNIDLIDVPYTIPIDEIPNFIDKCLVDLGRLQVIFDDNDEKRLVSSGAR